MSALAISCPSTSKARGRPLGATALAIRSAVHDLTDTYERMTVRQVFYALEVAEIVEDAMAVMARTYRRDLWQAQDARIEVWLEKDALADIVTGVTDGWDVSLMVSRGQSSATFSWRAAMAAQAAWTQMGVETFIYALYDRDAGGRRAARTIERDLPEHAPGVPVTFTLLGVTDEQVEDWQLPTRPAKKSDPEADKFDGLAVELDAIPPDKLVDLVENAIMGHVDARAWGIEQAVEREEREVLLRIAGEATA